MATERATGGGGGGAQEKVVWNEKEAKFETEDGKAFLLYHLDRRRSTTAVAVMDMVHTYVPRSKRRKGIAADLCNAAFNHAKENSLEIIPTCTYISDTFLPRNPNWSYIVFGNDPTTSPAPNLPIPKSSFEFSEKKN